MTLLLEKDGISLEFHWVPAHEGVKGNEAAHTRAADTTKKGVRPQEPSRYMLLALRSALVRNAKRRIQDLTQKDFNQTSTGKYTRTLDGALPRKHAARMYEAIPAEDARILIQLRTSHGHLNSYLATRRIITLSVYECGSTSETVRHFLLDCPRWQEQRNALIRTVGDRWGDISYILGGWSNWVDRITGKGKDGEKANWRPNMAAVRATIKFIKSIGRLTFAPVYNRTASH